MRQSFSEPGTVSPRPPTAGLPGGSASLAGYKRLGEDRRAAVSDVRLHIGFASAPGDPATQIYDDFGLLSTADELDCLVAAADDERAAIGQGMPLTCLTIAFEWEPVTKYGSSEEFVGGFWLNSTATMRFLRHLPGK